MCGLATAATLAAFSGVAVSARGPAVQLTDGEHAALPQAGVFGTAVTRTGRQLVVWRAAATEGENARLWGRALAPDGSQRGGRLAISGARADGSHESVIAGALAVRGKRDEFLVAWTEGGEDGVGSRVMARRVGRDGRMLAEPFVVAAEPRFSELGGIDVAYGGRRREFVVVFNAREAAGYAVYAARLAGGSETVSKTVRISARSQTLGERPASPSVAYDVRGDRFLAAWRGVTGRERGGSDRDVYVRTLDGTPSGRRLGRTRRISPPATSGGISLQPDVAYNRAARQFAVSWTGGPGLDDSRIYVRRVGPGGRPRGAPGLVDGDGASSSSIAAAPGGQYVVVFNRRGPREDDLTVLARRVGPRLRVRSARAVPTDAAVRAASGGVAYSIRAASFVVAWSETQEERGAASPTPPKYDVFTRHL